VRARSGGGAAPHNGTTRPASIFQIASQRASACSPSAASDGAPAAPATANARASERSPTTRERRAATPMPADFALSCSAATDSARIVAVVRPTASHANSTSGSSAQTANIATKRRPILDARMLRTSGASRRGVTTRRSPRARPA